MLTFVFIVAFGLAVFFSFWNGFTDAANAISTIVATRVLRPIEAVALSAFGNFIGMFFGVAVAQTIGKGIISSEIVTAELIIAALVGALIYDIITWIFGLPVSESHVLIGGLIGAGFAAAGINAVNLSAIYNKVTIPMVVSPLSAIVVAFIIVALVINLFRKHSAVKMNRYFRRLQILSSLFFSITHGTNDAQKTMGIMTLLLLSYGFISTFEVPLWVIILAHASISFETFFGDGALLKP